MKTLTRRIWPALFVMVWAAAASAEPFLVCDPPPAEEHVTHYGVRNVDTGADEIVPAPLHYDMGALPDGQINFEVRAVNVFGQESDPAPFAVRKQPPSSPAGLVLSSD